MKRPTRSQHRNNCDSPNRHTPSTVTKPDDARPGNSAVAPQEPTPSCANIRRRPRHSHGDGEDTDQMDGRNCFTRSTRTSCARRGATANRARRHQPNAAGAQARGAAAPSGDGRAEREHHEERRAIKGSSKGFFSQAVGGAFGATFYVQSFGARLWRSSMNWRAVWRSIFFFDISLQDAFDRSRLVRPVS